MPLEQIIIIIVIVVLVAVFAWSIFKKLSKMLFYMGIVIFVLLALNLFFVYQDFVDLRKNFGVSEKKVILVDGDKVLTALLLGEEVEPMTSRQMNEFSSYLKDNNYKAILGDSYKLMVFDVGIISNLDTDIDDGNKVMSNDDAVMRLRSDVASAEEKAALFSVILADNILSSKNPLFFFSQFKEGNIVIYPETALFKSIKLIPVSFIENIGKKIFEKGKEKAKSFVAEQE